MAKRSAELSSIVVEESEIEDFFEAQRDAIGQRPPTVVFAQIILDPTPSDSVWEAARVRAQEIYEMALAGEDFGELARRFSEDASKEGGGDLGWFRRGDMLPAFEDAAFGMVVDEISPPVRSQVGYHLIKVTRRRSGEIRASHILLLVRPSEADVETTRALAEQLRTRIQSGEDLAALREEYGDTEEPDTLEVPMAQLQDLPPGFAEPLSRAQAGEVLEPIRYEARGTPRFSVVKVVDVLPAGPYTLDDADLRSRITQTLQQEKLLDKILEELRASTYVQILL
jgi:parvulin-like peptidyl-prolyl isomerase